MQLFLQVVFATVHKLPRYNTVPDLKDSLYAIGYLCEKLMRGRRYSFTRSEFLSTLAEYCAAQLIDIEIDTLFAMLCECNLLMLGSDGRFHFRYSYWLFFFAANRMHHDKAFYNFVIESRRYANFPGIIEFYSGIDRRSTELLAVLLSDLDALNTSFIERTEFSDKFEPFEGLTWEPDVDVLEKARAAIESESANSRLPVDVKDAIADRSYDRAKPYKQSISTFLDDASMFVCIQVMRASSIALRNSDHADVDTRRRLLGQIMLTWARELRVVATLSPILSEDGVGGVDGLNFYLDESLLRYPKEERLTRLINSIPWNVANYYQADFFSAKMGPLYYDYLWSSADAAARHILLVQIIRGKPKGWAGVVERYISELDKNAFYLLDVTKELKKSFDLDFDMGDDRAKLKLLVGTAYSKHLSKKKKPSEKDRLELANTVLSGDVTEDGRAS
jgi:hypothetical protein